jgi:hypothetical protein
MDLPSPTPAHEIAGAGTAPSRAGLDPRVGDLGRRRPQQWSGKLCSGCAVPSPPLLIRCAVRHPGGQPCRPSAGRVEPTEVPPQRPLQRCGTRDAPLWRIFFRGGRRSVGAFSFTLLSRCRRRQAGGEAAASWPGAMDGDGGGGRGCQGQRCPDRPPLHLIHLPLGGLDRSLPFFLLLGLWDEFPAKIKIFYFLFRFLASLTVVLAA